MKINDSCSCVRFDEFEVDLGSAELFHHGERLVLQRKPFQILEQLLRSPGEVVSRESLFQVVWPNVHVDQQRCLNSAIRKLRLILADQARRSHIIETVGNRGYRLLPTVVPAERHLPKSPHMGKTLAVLLFENLSNPEDELFSCSMTDQMIAQFAQSRNNVFLIAPVNPLLRNKRAGNTMRAKRKETADYLLCGSILREDTRIRVTAKLIRTKDQVCVWAHSYVDDGGEVFAIQERVARQILRAVLRTLSFVT